MQNSKRPGMTHASSTNNDVPKNTTLIQIQPNSLQHQKLIPINSMQKNLTSKLYAIQGTSGPTHFLPVQCNNGQFLRLQNPSGQLKQNIIQLPATPVSSLNTSNATLISLQPQSVNTQNVNFRTVTPSLNNSQFILSNNKLLFKSPTPTVNQQQGKTNFIKINPAPQSLVGSVSNGQSTPLIRIDNSGASSNFTQSQQKIFILNSSPMKVDQYIPEKVFIQDNNAANLPMQVDSETCQSNAVNQTMFQQTNQQHVEISTKPKLQDVSFQDQLNNTIPQNFLLANMSPQKADASIEKQKTVPGTLLLLNNFQKQQVLIPKASQSNQVFVPITLAGNLSLINSQTDVSKHTAQQRFIPLQYDQSSKTLTQVNNQPQQQSSIFISGQGVQQEAGGAGSSFIFQPISNTKSNSHSAKSSERKSHKSSTSSKNSIKPKETSSSSSAISKSEKKPCNCTKSQCLKLYCECFANGEFCSNCNCRTCRNNIEYEAERSRAIKVCLERNPYAFHPKIGKGKIKGDTERRHTKGCNCKRSGCLKNYCECFEAKILCSSLCRCSGCKNFLESADQKTLMHLADAAEERVLQQNAARSKLATEMTILESKPILEPKERLPSAFITHDVTKATCETLLARVQEAETAELSVAESERIIFEEFSRCLNQIIDKSKQQKQVRAKR